MTANFRNLPWPTDPAPVPAQQVAEPSPASTSNAPGTTAGCRTSTARTPTICGLEALPDLGAPHLGLRMPWWW
ncbi:hypothetical protein PV410_24905 [Streptomyces sp. PA03-5A]|nr:hypothetical protein [Streptomyces sp. PA03-5A]